MMSGLLNPYSGKKFETKTTGEGEVCADLSSTLDRPLKDTAPTLASEVDRPSIFYGVVLVGSSAFDTLSYRPLGVVVRRLEVEEGGEGGGRGQSYGLEVAGDLPRLQIYTRSVTGVRTVNVLPTRVSTVLYCTVVHFLCNYYCNYFNSDE